jgi:hypothetical protein
MEARERKKIAKTFESALHIYSSRILGAHMLDYKRASGRFSFFVEIYTCYVCVEINHRERRADEKRAEGWSGQFRQIYNEEIASVEYSNVQER